MITLEQLQAGIVIPIDKPRQWTSFQAVNKIKAVLRQYIRDGERLKVKGETDNTSHLSPLTSHLKIKIGHAGTLDPLASGLLLVCIGKATKTIPQLQDGDKVYSGTMVFGATTPCYDLERPVDHYYPYEHITQQLVEETAQQFTGTIQQVPPMFSAVKIAGQRAYEYAREGERLKVKGETDTVETKEIKPKEVNIYSFEITAFRNYQNTPNIPNTPNNQNTPNTPNIQNTPIIPTSHLYKAPLGEVPPHLPQADFRIHCGKGTYIRSLARDLGLALGSGAFLSALRREKVGEYSINQSIKPDEIQQYLTSL